MIRDSSSDQVARAMREDSRSASPSIEKIRAAVARHRDLDAELEDLEQRRDRALKEQLEIERQLLPELFSSVGVDRVDIPAEGNLPAATASIERFCRASIPASWSSDKRAEAFRVLERLGLGDVIKSVVSVEFARRESQGARELAQRLESMGLRPSLSMSAHHATLTSAVREMCDEGRAPSAEEMEAIGASVGNYVCVRFRPVRKEET